MSAFYVSNRKDGFVLSGSILAKSKFYGNSLSAILDGVGRLVFLKRGEDYLLTMPYAHCKGSETFDGTYPQYGIFNYSVNITSLVLKFSVSFSALAVLVW